MSGGDEWGPWIEHDGMGCPKAFLLGKIVELALADPEENMAHYANIVLLFGDSYSDDFVKDVEGGGGSWVLPVTEQDRLYVYRYRVRKPKGLSVLEEILERLPDWVTA
jgi:hypothetical protein